MDVHTVLQLLLEGKLTIEEAEKYLKLLAIEELGNYVRFDLGRELRRGIPEIILAEGKDPNILTELVKAVVNKVGRVIVSRVSKEQIEYLKSLESRDLKVIINEQGRIVTIKKRNFEEDKLICRVGIVTAGTSDIPIAEEVKSITEEFICCTKTIYDVGVAGLHRTLRAVKELKEFDTDIVIAIAGREGALPSVLASLIDVPIIAVPTSSGYGAGGRGLAALFSMLQSCSLGLAVVNIDNGVGAALFTLSLCRLIDKLRRGR